MYSLRWESISVLVMTTSERDLLQGSSDVQHQLPWRSSQVQAEPPLWLALGKTCLHNPLISLCSASLECGTDSGNIPEACLLLSACDSQQFLDWSWIKTAPPTAWGHRTPLNWASATRVLQENVHEWRTATHLYWGFHQLSNRHNNAAAKVWTCICILIFGGFYPTLTTTFKTLVRIYVHLRGSEKKKKE